MELINYLASLLLILLAVFAKFNPTIISGYNSLPEEKKEKFPLDHMMWGLLVTAFLTPVVSYNIRFVGYEQAANWSFIVTITIGILITIWVVNKKLNRD